MTPGARAALCGWLVLVACRAPQDDRANPTNQAKTTTKPSAAGVVSALPSSLSLPTPTLRLATRVSATASAACTTHSAPPPHPISVKQAPEATRALSPQLGVWLVDEQRVLLSATPDPAWADGPPSFVGANTVLRGVVIARLPKALRAWLGRPVRVLGANGAVCETRLQRFAVRAQVTPDAATAEVWDGCAEPPLAPAVIAEQIWRLSANSGRSLVAEFSAPCQGALLAVDPTLPAPAIAAPEPAAAELGERALTAFRQLPAYQAVQARFKAAQPDAAGAWDDHEAQRGVWSLALPNHTPLVFVSVEVGKGCRAETGFSASLSALWSDAGGQLNALLVPEALDDRRLRPQAVIDLNGDGSAAVLLGPDGQFAARSLLEPSKAAPGSSATPGAAGTAAFSKVLLQSVPFFAGPC